MFLTVTSILSVFLFNFSIFFFSLKPLLLSISIKNWFMLGVRVLSYGCTWKV